ncbi:MAG: PTS galactitol transporter subunit IIC, partial [Coriobacteriales bacterium]|nr:PTS galactitol transporter subunit IIC [Coriobacteriales bacterium]
IEGIIVTPVYLLASSSFAPYLTELARTYSPDSLSGVGNGAMITWSTLETPDFRWSIANALSGHPAGIVALIVWLALFVWMLKEFKKRNAKLKAEQQA